MTLDFHSPFEDQDGTSRAEIISRLKVYLPFVEPLKTMYDACHAVDLGCGRGEWLELLRDIGIEAQGVEVDDAMLAACRERGLSVQTGEATAVLKSLPDDSQVIVSALHLAERQPFSEVVTLVREGLRVLRPAGVLILETAGPKNLAVGAADSDLDPTYVHPIDPQMVLFLAEYFGFSRSVILRPSELPELVATKEPGLQGVIGGVSPGFSIVGQKSAPPQSLGRFEQAFGKEYRVARGTAATFYDRPSEDRIGQVDLVFGDMHEEQADLRLGVQKPGSGVEELHTEAGELRQRADGYLLQLQEIPSGNSRTITASRRALRIEENLRRSIPAALNVLRRIPLTAALLNSIKRRFPGLWAVVSSRVRSQDSAAAMAADELARMRRLGQEWYLSPRARRIYADLRAATDKKP